MSRSAAKKEALRVSDGGKQSAKAWQFVKAFWPDMLLFGDLLVLFLIIGVACIYVVWPEGDPMEHINASYRVYLGDVPYRDFFEHHHGLLWYIAAPVVGLMARNTAVYEVLNYATFLFFSWGLYFVYRTIREFMGGRTAGLIAIVFLLVPDIFVYYVYFKPDNWMFTGISGGIYYFFVYFAKKRRRDLVWSYLFFFFSFAMCQKALFYFPVIGLFSLWALYKKEMNGKDFAVSLAICLLLGGGILGYFYYQDALTDYFLLCFKFNGGMVKLFGEARVLKPDGWFFYVTCTGILVSLVCYKFESRYFRIYSWVFWGIFLQKWFYFAPHHYYWYEAYYFAVPLVAGAVVRLLGKKKILLYLVVLEMQFYTLSMAYDLYVSTEKRMKNNSLMMQDIVGFYTNPCDEVVSFSSGLVLFNKVPMYYWFILGELDVFGEKLGFHKVENLNQIIEERLPKVIYLTDVTERYAEDKKNPPLIHKPDMKMIEKYYYPSVFSSDEGELDIRTFQREKYDYRHGMWLLKPEFRSKMKCIRDKESGRWGYVSEN